MVPILLLLSALPFSNAFVHVAFQPQRLTFQGTADERSSGCHMARLYEDPLPPRPPPRKLPDDTPPTDKTLEDFDDDSDFYDDFVSDQRLFSFHMNGTEVNGWLPPLGRSLDSGIPCYFEPNDRKVQNLVGKAFCHEEDACWALEACRGDIIEAWTCISMAQRMILADMVEDDVVRSGEMDRDVYELELEEEFEERKAERQQQQRIRDRNEFFSGGQPNQNVWPGFKPGPDESEPWFTG